MISGRSSLKIVKAPNGAESAPLSLCVQTPFSNWNVVRGVSSVKEKRKLSSGLTTLGLPLSTALQRRLPTNGFRNVGPNSLSPTASETLKTTEMIRKARKAFPRRFSSGVRTDLPMSKYCSHGNRLRFNLLCSKQNNRYYNQDLH